jgi:hypothetical protein
MKDLDILSTQVSVQSDLVEAQELEEHQEAGPACPAEFWPLARAFAACAAARYLAISGPEQISIIGGPKPLLWLYAAAFPEADIRHVVDGLSAEAACAADIVVVGAGSKVLAEWIADGTHVDIIEGHSLARELPARSCNNVESLLDGRFAPRQGDEITLFEHRQPPWAAGFLWSKYGHLLQ